LCLAASHCLALDPEKTIFQNNCRTWTRQNGLPADGVNAIAQTADGYLWLGTADGLVSFDGIEFKSHRLNQLQSQIVTSLSSSRDGGLWMGMEHGAFAYYDGQNITYQGKESWGGVNLNIHSILETSDHTVWLAAETQLAILTKERLFQTVGSNDTTALMQDSKGRIWIGTAHHGLFWWENGVLTQFPDHAVDGQEIRALTEDKNGQLWIGTDWGPFCYDSNFLRKDFPFPWYPIRALLVDREGALWMGTTGAGLIKYQNGTTTSFRKQDGLVDDNVSALAEDQEGNLWVGTRSGLSEFSDFKIPTFTKTEGVPAEIITDVSASRNGGLWLATGHGFTYFDGKGNSSTTLLGLTNEYVNRIFEAKNRDIYLINGYKDIEIFRGTNVLARYTNDDWPTAFGEDDKGVVVSVGKNLFRVGTNYFSPFPFVGGQNPELGWIFNIATGRDGSLWLATDAGICSIKDGVFKLWSAKDGLADSHAVWVCEDNEGVVWAGLNKGIARIKDGKVTTVNHDHGLFDDIIYSAIPDNRGRLWVDSSRGFFSLEIGDFDDFTNGKTNHVTCTDFTGLDGVKSSDRFQQKEAGCRTLDGRIWFPTAQGVAMIDPDRIKTQSVPPRIYVQSTRVDGTEFKPREKTVRPGKGNLEFQYTGLSYIAPQRIHYRYMLEGYDKEWVDAGTRRAAFYTNLKPGQYRFLVQACNEDGVWSTDPASVDVELLPYFYQTAWFISIAVAAFIAALLAIYAWRLKLLTHKQQQLQKNRDLLEAEVASRTTELAYERDLLGALLEYSPDPIYFKDLQSRFLKTSRHMVVFSGMKDVNDLVGKTDFDFFAEEHARPAFEDEQEIMRTGLPLIGKVEKEVLKGGRETWALTSKMPLRDKAGQIIGTFGISKDITVIKQGEVELAYQRDLLETLMDYSPDSIFFKDLQSRFVRVSRSEVNNLRRVSLSHYRASHPADGEDSLPSHLASVEEFEKYVIGKSDAEIYGHERAGEFAHDEEEIVRTGQPMIGKIEQTICPDGSVIWYMTTKVPWRNKDGEIIGTFGTAREISDLKNAEAKLEQVNKQLQWKTAFLEAQVNSSIDGILVVDQEGKKSLQNQRFADLFKIPQGIIDGNDDAAQVLWITNTAKNPEQFAEKICYLNAHPNEISRDEIELKGGTILDRYSSPVVGQDGKYYGRIWTFRDITERKRVEEASAAQQRLLDSLIAAVPDLIYFKDRESRFVRINEAFARRSGLIDVKAALGKTDFDLFGEQHARQAYEDEQRIMATGQPMINKEEREDWPDGRITWATSTKLPMFDNSGKIAGIMGISHDITDLKRADVLLRRTEELYRNAIAGADAVPYSSDLKTKSYVFMGEGIQQLIGYAPHEVNDALWQKIIQKSVMLGETAGLDKDEAARRVASGDIRHWRCDMCITTRDGKTRWIADASVLKLDESGQPIGSMGILQDITERKLADESANRLAAIIEYSDEAIISETLKGIITSWNSAAEKMFGYTPSEIIGQPLQVLVPPDYLHEEVEILAGFARGELVRHFETVRIRKNGQRFDVSTTISPIKDSDGKIIGASKIIRDITERKRLEAQLVQSQKMETVGKLAGGFAHEFNSILTAIIGQSELLLGDLPAGSPLAKNATEISKAAGRAARLTQQLLAYGRKQFLQQEILDLNRVIASMESMFHHLMGIEVDTQIVPAPDLQAVKADAGQIEQVIMNMAINARDAMPNGGKLTLETANVSFDPESVGRYPELKPGNYVMLAITDTGMGMSEEVKARIFEPFFTTKGVGQGTGLGLSTCYGIVKQSGGHISVYSEPGRGTTFKIYLPQVEQKAKISIQRLDSPDLPRGTETILLVEDDPALREMAATLLRRLGYTVLTAANGIEALSVKHERSTGHIDLLFTDVVMPHMSGKELADRVRALYPYTKILFTSAYTENAIVHQGVLNKGVNLLQKPFTPSALAHKLREVLDQQGAPNPDNAQKETGFEKISEEAKTPGN